MTRFREDVNSQRKPQAALQMKSAKRCWPHCPSTASNATVAASL